MIATVLHFVFSILALERDLKFWVHKKTFFGVSFRSILISLVNQLIIFVSLVNPQSERSVSWLFRFFSLMGVLNQLWKLTKMLQFCRHFPFFERKAAYSGETDEADAIGSKLFAWVLIPCSILFVIYELVYGKYYGIWQYVVHCGVGIVYTFEFLQLVPQLYVNYRLQTVAGMSASAFGYKFISTFIDDLYAFLSDLPLIHKIGCLRDDVVFVVWLFQWWKYPVDEKRVNEFGLVSKGEDEVEKEGEPEEEKPEEEKGKLKTD
jgi:hypothetical protein